MQGGDVVDGDQQRRAGRGIAVVLAQVQHEIAPRHLQVQRRRGVEAMLPVQREAEKIEVELARLGFGKTAQDRDGSMHGGAFNMVAIPLF